MTQSRVADANERWIAFGGDLTTILVAGADTNGRFSLLETRKPAGGATPIHEHAWDSETVYVISGELSAQTVAGTCTLGAGEVATLAPGARHRLANLGSTETHYLLLCQPAGFEAFVSDVGLEVGDQPSAFPALSPDEIANLAAAAPRYGITLLGQDALPPIATDTACISSQEPHETIDTIGVVVEIFAELGNGDDAIAVIRAVFAPGAIVPLHGHPDAELFYVEDGRLDLYRVGTEGDGWTTLGAGDIAEVKPNVRHAVRNRYDRPAIVLTVMTGRLLRFLRAIARPEGAAHGPPSAAEIDHMLSTADSFGHWNGTPAENAAIGLTLGG